MQIVSDTGMDLYVPAEMIPDTDVHILRQTITINGKTYRSGVDITPDNMDEKLYSTKFLPVTSLPSPGEFAEMYHELAKVDPDILSIHISSGLSGTVNAARQGAEMAPEANVTIHDTKTLSSALGWQVLAAARAIKAGWNKERILDLMQRISDATETVYTLKDLKYLIAGGRIGHMKGLLASLLRIFPIIGVEKTNGTYVQLGMSRNFDKALDNIVDMIKRRYPEGSRLLVQVVHADNPQAAQQLHQLITKSFDCHWLPEARTSAVLAAHTGPTLVGVIFAPLSILEAIP